MLKGIFKWRRKRPREPGRTSTVQEPSQSSRTRRFTLFKKQLGERVPTHLSTVQSTAIEPTGRQARLSALDVATPASKVLLYVCEAPPLGFLKPVAGFANQVCEMFQAVRSYKEATEILEEQALEAESIINNSAEPMSPRFMKLVQILEEIRRFLDAADSVTAKYPRRERLRLCFIAPRERDRARALGERLRDVRSVLQTTTTLNLEDSLRRIESRQIAEQAQYSQQNTDHMGAVVATGQTGPEN